MSDPDLLQRYVETGSQEAFAALVKRHLDLVYSAAQRQVRSPQLAEEVAQSVFLDLSRKARTLQPGAPLAAWLYLVTRRTSIDVIRRESRRQAREQTAVAIAAMNTSPPAWTTVEPLLDEAMESLDATDRSAVLLRYFENQSLREVGQSLGTSEDAAQKRVSRAVEQLRIFFLKHGITISAAGLATDLSAHAIQTAPIGLNAAISATATVSSMMAPHAAIETAKALSMTTIQKSLIFTFVAVLGTGLYEARVILRQNEELLQLRQQAHEWPAEIRQLTQERDDAIGKLTRTQHDLEAARLKNANDERAALAADPAMEREMMTWLARAAKLKGLLEQMPDKKIPELQFLTVSDWLAVAKDAQLETDEQIRKALGELRLAAKQRFVPSLQAALRQYIKSNDGQLPGDPTLLGPYFDSPVDPAILPRYKMLRTEKLVSDVPNGASLVTDADNSFVDDEFESRVTVGIQSKGWASVSKLGEAAKLAAAEFSKANNGKRPNSSQDLLPYFNPPLDSAQQEKFLKPTNP